MAHVKWYGDAVMMEVEKAQRKGLRKAGSVVAKKAKSLVPVGIEDREVTKRSRPGSKVDASGQPWSARRPGTLKKSIRYRVVKKGKKVQIIAGGRSGSKLTAWYAIMVEFGGKNRIAYPYLRPALHSTETQIVEMFKDTMK